MEAACVLAAFEKYHTDTHKGTMCTSEPPRGEVPVHPSEGPLGRMGVLEPSHPLLPALGCPLPGLACLPVLACPPACRAPALPGPPACLAASARLPWGVPGGGGRT